MIAITIMFFSVRPSTQILRKTRLTVDLLHGSNSKRRAKQNQNQQVNSQLSHDVIKLSIDVIFIAFSGGVANLFPGHQKTAAPELIIEKPKTPEVINSPVPEVSESEWETDVTEDEQEQVVVKQDTPHLEDALAKLDQLDLESDDEMRYQRQSKTAGKREEKPHVVVQPPLVEASHPNPPQMTNGTNGMNGFHKEEVEEAVVEEEAAPTSTFISEMIDIDDLLMKGSHFVALDSSPVFFNEEEDSTPKTLSDDFTNAKPIADIVQVGAVTTIQGGFLFIPHSAVGSPVYTI